MEAEARAYEPTKSSSSGHSALSIGGACASVSQSHPTSEEAPAMLPLASSRKKCVCARHVPSRAGVVA
eukprot:scaffold118310_cov66-Phaeocystis_antarctica.AAC.6